MFYCGCTPRNRELMDSSSEGSFENNTVCQGLSIISRIARNGDSYKLHHERERSPHKTRFESVQFVHDEDDQDTKLEINYVSDQQTLFNGQTEQRTGLYAAEDLDHESDELRAEMNELKGMMKAFMVTQETSKAKMYQKIKDLEAGLNEQIDKIFDSFTTLVARAKLVQEKLNFNMPSIEPNEDKCLYLIDDERTVEPVSDEEAPSLDEQLSADSHINHAESDADHGTDLKAELQTHEFEIASQLSGLTISTSRRVPKVYQPRWSWEKSKLEDDAFKRVNQSMKTMDGTVECDYLLESNKCFKECYVRMLMSTEWYESRRHLTEGQKPLTRFWLPHHYFQGKHERPNFPNGNTLREPRQLMAGILTSDQKVFPFQLPQV